jgi:hypothetical protein
MGGVHFAEDGGLDAVSVPAFEVQHFEGHDWVHVDPFTEVAKIDRLLSHEALVDFNQSIISNPQIIKEANQKVFFVMMP